MRIQPPQTVINLMRSRIVELKQTINNCGSTIGRLNQSIKDLKKEKELAEEIRFNAENDLKVLDEYESYLIAEKAFRASEPESKEKIVMKNQPGSHVEQIPDTSVLNKLRMPNKTRDIIRTILDTVGVAMEFSPHEKPRATELWLPDSYAPVFIDKELTFFGMRVQCATMGGRSARIHLSDKTSILFYVPEFNHSMAI